MNIDGVNTLACTKPMDDIKGSIRIYPLPHQSVIKDLVPDLSHFFSQHEMVTLAQDRDAGARRRMEAEPGGPREGRRPLRMHPVRLLSTSCPEYWWNPDRYLGPASLLHAYRWVIDSRDEATGERLDQPEDPFRLYRCVLSSTAPRRVQSSTRQGRSPTKEAHDRTAED